MPEKMTSLKIIKQKLFEKNFAPRKSLGQNFLIDDNILRKIVNASRLEKDDLILEIGPGLGALTEALVESVKKVIAVEYDRGLYTILTEEFVTTKNLQLINEDIMKTDLATIFCPYPHKEYQYKVIANLPYYITTPVIFKLIEANLPWELMVFLVQKEVADRLGAKPGTKDYGALTVMLGFYGRVEKIAVVPKTVFYPSPQVDSMVIRITPDKEQWDWQLYPYLRRVVQAAFGQRRKTILNTLASLECFRERKEMLADYLRELRIDSQRRGETLTLPEFLNLAKEMRSRESRRCINGVY